MKVLGRMWLGLVIVLVGLAVAGGVLWKVVQPIDEVAPVTETAYRRVEQTRSTEDRNPTITIAPQEIRSSDPAATTNQRPSIASDDSDSKERLLHLIEELEQSGRHLSPGAIESSGIPVHQNTGLELGQILQVKWGSQGTWWAAKVTSLEDVGRVGIHYVGWASTYDEIVPRDRLQLDPEAHVKALQTESAESRLRSLELNDRPN